MISIHSVFSTLWFYALILLVATSAGSLLSLLLHKSSTQLLDFLLGFVSGIMIVVSFLEFIVLAMEKST